MDTARLAFFSLFLPACTQTPAQPEAPVVGGGIVVASERWDLSGFAVGTRAGNHDSSEGGMGMADAVRLDDGAIRLYYAQAAAPPMGSNILVAESRDGGRTFTPRPEPALMGSLDDHERTRLVGGPSVVRLVDGRWRMFVRSAAMTGAGEAPDYHLRSAISSDGGLTFRDEGVVLDNSRRDPASRWFTVGHSRVYRLGDGTWAAVVSVQPSQGAPTDLALFTSPDARSFSYQRTIYVGWHDPVVIERGDEYLMVAQYADKYTAFMVSLDGLHWYPQVSRVELADPSGLRSAGAMPGMVTADYRPGDFAALVGDDGHLMLFSNFSPAGAPEVAGIPMGSSVATYRPQQLQ